MNSIAQHAHERADKWEPHDGGRLDHHRVRRADGALGLRPGPRRQRALAGGLRGRRLRGQPPRAAAAGAGLELALRAAVQPRHGAGGRRRRGDRLRGGGSRDPAPAVLFPVADVVDGIGGAVLVATLGLGLVWIAGAVALQTPGARQYRKDIQRSAILRKLNEVLPPSGPILNALARVDPFPRITGPEADVPPPNRRILRDADVQAARTTASCACSAPRAASPCRAPDGSPRRSVVVTNAHVVAGEDDTTVKLDGGDELDAQAIAFDPHNDVAVLRVPGLGAPRARAAHAGAGRRGGRDPRLSRRTVPTGPSPGRLGDDADGDQPGRLRRRAGPAADDLAARADPLRELGRAGGRRDRRRGRDGVRRHDVRDRRAGSACRRGSCGPRCARQRAGRHGALRARAAL